MIPPPPRKPANEYQRKPGAGRKPLSSRQVFEAIVFALRTGIQWKALPKERFGSPSSIHRYFQQWERDGFFASLWQAGLAEYEDMQGIAWKWQGNAKAKVRASRGATAPGKKRQQTPPVDGRAWRPAVARRQRRQAI